MKFIIAFQSMSIMQSTKIQLADLHGFQRFIYICVVCKVSFVPSVNINTFLETHDVDAYLREIDTCCEMPGVKSFVLSGIPARDYVMILKIRTLREARCEEDARALLETAKQEMKGEKALLLLRDEEEKLDRRQK